MAPPAMCPTTGQELHDRQTDGALATTRLADNADAFPFCHRETDAIYSAHIGGPQVEFSAQVLDFENVGHVHHPFVISLDRRP